MMWKRIVVAVLALIVSACANTMAKEPPKVAGKCGDNRNSLDDFGPGVEDCRHENAPELDDFPARK